MKTRWTVTLALLAGVGLGAVSLQGLHAQAVAPAAGVDALQDKVKTAMALLIAKTGELGAPKLDGTDTVAGRSVPGLYFGSTKMNNFFDVVDAVVREVGGTATLFVRADDDYVRVATNVKKDDGSRAIGTILDPKGKAIETIKRNEAYYGEADILGKAYVTGYEPIRDLGKNPIGIYYVGYLKN
jgi:hypothetical protein